MENVSSSSYSDCPDVSLSLQEQSPTPISQSGQSSLTRQSSSSSPSKSSPLQGTNLEAEEGLRRDLESANREIANFQAELNSLKVKLETEQTRSVEQQEKISELTEANSKVKVQFEGERSKLEKEVAKHKAECASHVKTKEELKGTKAELEKQVNQYKQEHQLAQLFKEKFTKSEATSKELGAKLSTADGENAKLTKLSTSQTSTIADLKSKLEETTNALTNTTAELDKETSTRKQAQETVSAQAYELRELQAELTATHKELTLLGELHHTTVENAKSREAELTTTLNNSNEQLTTSEANLEERDKTIASLKALSGGLKDTRNRQNEEITKLRATLTSNAVLLEKRRCEILSLQHSKEVEAEEFDKLNDELRKSFGREMELRGAAQYKRTIGMSHATIRAYDTPLPKITSPTSKKKKKGSRPKTPSS